MSEPLASAPVRHSFVEDAQGIAFGTLTASFGLLILTHLGLVTGQTAGLAVLISYATGWNFGPVFFVINLPFYWFGYRRLGLTFVIKSFVSVALVSVLTLYMPVWIVFEWINPVVGAILTGAITGTALLALFRHGASLGGIGILALYLQDRTGFRAGYTQLIFDGALFAVALALRDPMTVALSVLGAAVLDLVIAINHRRDRYVAT